MMGSPFESTQSASPFGHSVAPGRQKPFEGVRPKPKHQKSGLRQSSCFEHAFAQNA